MMFFPLFITTFFNIGKHKLMLPVCLTIGVIFMIADMAVSGDETTLGLFFNLSCVCILASILFCGSICVKALKSGNKEALPILIAIVIGIAFAVHDVVYSMQGQYPFVWLQGIGICLLNIATFVVLSLRLSKLKVQAERFAKEIDEKTQALSRSFMNMKEAGASLVDLGKELDSAASLALSASVSSEARGIDIGEKAGHQAQEAESANRLVNDFVASIDNINQNLTAQTESLSNIAANGERMDQAADLIVTNTEHTAAFTGSLAALTQNGVKAALSLDETMRGVSDSSNSIADLVAVVEEFVEQTNLLAMNAAIEAAHAGAEGKGFSIIAGEIKRLAESQKKQVVTIRDVVTGILRQIKEGAAQTDRMRESLSEIARGADEAAQKIGEVLGESRNQKDITREMRGAVEGFSTSFGSIGEELKRQGEYSSQVRNAVNDIASESKTVQSATEEIIAAISELQHTIRSLRDLAARSREMTDKLSSDG
jgi:methyl-accepting chemotaxis protein